MVRRAALLVLLSVVTFMQAWGICAQGTPAKSPIARPGRAAARPVRPIAEADLEDEPSARPVLLVPRVPRGQRVDGVLPVVRDHVAVGAGGPPVLPLDIGTGVDGEDVVNEGVVAEGWRYGEGRMPTHSLGKDNPFFHLYIHLTIAPTAALEFELRTSVLASVGSSGTATPAAKPAYAVTVESGQTGVLKSETDIHEAALYMLCQHNGTATTIVELVVFGTTVLSFGYVKTCELGNPRKGFEISSKNNGDGDVATGGVVTSFFDNNLDSNYAESSTSDHADRFYVWMAKSGTSQAFRVAGVNSDEELVRLTATLSGPSVALPRAEQEKSGNWSVITVSYDCVSHKTSRAIVSVSLDVANYDPITFEWVKKCASQPGPQGLEVALAIVGVLILVICASACCYRYWRARSDGAKCSVCPGTCCRPVEKCCADWVDRCNSRNSRTRRRRRRGAGGRRPGAASGLRSTDEDLLDHLQEDFDETPFAPKSAASTSISPHTKHVDNSTYGTTTYTQL